MLFDLRSRRRRRAVKIIYLGLAIVMGGGLVLFGIGTGTGGGGLLDAFNNNSSTSTSDIFKKRTIAAEHAVQLRPRDSRAWQNLARLRFQQATGDGFDSNSQTFTVEGRALLGRSDEAWARALELTDKPDPNIARQMVQVYSSVGLNKPDKAIEAYEVVLPTIKPPTAQSFVNYATLAYQAGQTRKAELASARALKLASKDDRAQIKGQLDDAKRAAISSSLSGASATVKPGATTTVKTSR